jgi:hypothetical protein
MIGVAVVDVSTGRCLPLVAVVEASLGAGTGDELREAQIHAACSNHADAVSHQR